MKNSIGEHRNMALGKEKIILPEEFDYLNWDLQRSDRQV